MSIQLSLDTLLDNKQPIYVKNVHVPRGIIVLSFVNPAGKPHRQVIPNAKRAPINLNEQVTPDMLRNSPDLRQLLSGGALELMDPAEAQEMLKNPHIQAELQDAWIEAKGRTADMIKARQPEKKEEVGMHVQNNAIVAGEVGDVEEQLQFKNSEEIEVISAESPDVQTPVKVIVSSMAEKEIKARDARNKLANLDLSNADLQYVVANSVPGLVSNYAKRQLAVLNGDPITDLEDDEASEE